MLTLILLKENRKSGLPHLLYNASQLRCVAKEDMYSQCSPWSASLSRILRFTFTKCRIAVLVFFYRDTSKPKFKPKIAPSQIDSNDSYQVWDSTFGENFGIDSGEEVVRRLRTSAHFSKKLYKKILALFCTMHIYLLYLQFAKSTSGNRDLLHQLRSTALPFKHRIHITQPKF